VDNHSLLLRDWLPIAALQQTNQLRHWSLFVCLIWRVSNDRMESRGEASGNHSRQSIERVSSGAKAYPPHCLQTQRGQTSERTTSNQQLLSFLFRDWGGERFTSANDA